jgi:cold shock protein
MAISTVKWFCQEKGYGFIVNPDGKDIFVHFSSILAEGFRTLGDGDQVEYELVDGEKGPYAVKVKCLVPNPRPPQARVPARERFGREHGHPGHGPQGRHDRPDRPRRQRAVVP